MKRFFVITEVIGLNLQLTQRTGHKKRQANQPTGGCSVGLEVVLPLNVEDPKGCYEAQGQEITGMNTYQHKPSPSTVDL